MALVDRFRSPYDPGEFWYGFGTTIAVFARGTDGYVQVRARVDSWVLVPEPESLALLVTALTLALARRRLTAAAA